MFQALYVPTDSPLSPYLWVYLIKFIEQTDVDKFQNSCYIIYVPILFQITHCFKLCCFARIMKVRHGDPQIYSWFSLNIVVDKVKYERVR